MPLRAVPYPGVKIASGTAHDVVFSMVAVRPRVSLTPGTGYLRGRSLCFEHSGQFPPMPVPRAVPARRLAPGALAVQEGRQGQVEEMTDEPLYRDRVCGIDIGKAGVYATIRVPSDANPAQRASETRCFATTRRGVLALEDWLRCWQVPAVVMEATGVLEAGVLPAGGRGVRVRARGRQAGQAPARTPEAGLVGLQLAGGLL